MKYIGAVLFATIAVQVGFAQVQRLDLQNMKASERKEAIRQMAPKDRMELLRQYREDIIIAELNVPQQKQPEFKSLYNEFQEKQSAIRKKFVPRENYDQLSNDEATKQLEQSFEIGQQLLDNRKAYSKKFTEVISPQQVLKMYQTEGRMRKKILDKKQDGSVHQNSQRRRP